MKINAFYDKNINKRTQRSKKTTLGVTQLIDSQTIVKLTKELEELENKLQLSKQLLETETKTHLKEKEGFSIAKKAAKEANEQLVKTTEQHNLLGLDVKTYQETITKQNTVIKELNDKVSSLTPIENSYKEFQAKYLQNITELQTATEKVMMLYSVKDSLEEQIQKLSDYKESTKEELKQLKTKYNSMNDVFSTFEQNNLDLKADLRESNREIQKWKTGFSTLEEENANLIGIKTNLSDWLGNIQEEKSELTDKSSYQDKELYKAKQTITELGKTVDDLISTNSYLRECNNTYINELNKPRYASIGAISRQEGFKFPSQFTAPKNSLGTGKPTLLKVRKP